MAAPALLKAAATEARLATLALPEGGAWITAARRAALGRLRAMGLPVRRDEYWRYTDPATLTAPEAPAAALFDPGDEGPAFADVDRLRLVLVDGVFDAAQSDDPAEEGIEIALLSEVAARDIHWARDLFGVLESAGQEPVARPLAALNTAIAPEGVVIRATRPARRPVEIVMLHRDPQSDVALHHLIRVEEGATLTLLETGPAAARLNSVAEVEVAPGAAFHHIRVQGRDHERRAATHVFATVAAGAVFKSFTLTFNGRLTRNESVLTITGDAANAHVAGVALGDGGAFHHDDTVFITHEAVGCESRQVFKKVLRNGATGVFQGKILVKPGAQKTDGYQISQSLLLDGDSQFLAKPELEIYADDVKCSHGSTSGAIDERALYYLRSRGIPHEEAQDLLVLAFVAEALDEIADARLADDLRGRLEGWLSRHRD
ncbi:MAG: SufD family Fe-S cluster assembly protein [Rubellimicrobium sp.]|nr:SufD family Fe-S cluster assembly protein [Rubellimicrobium sp.]